MREQWKTIEGYNYQVSSKGRIRNKTTKVVKKTFINERGYVVVSLYKEKKTKDVSSTQVGCFCIFTEP